MADIEIVFPSNGDKPFVTRESQAVLENQRVTWEITSYNKAVQRVKIEFKSGTDFFDSPHTPSNEINEPLHEYSGAPAQPIWRREIYGRAPDFRNTTEDFTEAEMKGGACRACKYTVSGLEANGGATGAVNDPKIVIARP